MTRRRESGAASNPFRHFHRDIPTIYDTYFSFSLDPDQAS
jgi:hypothetical protein